MTTPLPPPPVRSPEPPENPDDGSKSGGYRAITNAVRVVDEMLEEKTKKIDNTSLSTKIQWGVIGAVGLALAGFVAWALITLGTISDAQAQSRSTTRDFNLHMTTDVADKILINQRFDEQRKDTKALYDAVMTRKKQKRLEQMDAGEEGE